MLGLANTIVSHVRVEPEGDVVVGVRPSWRAPRCSGCGNRATGYDRRSTRRWRHLGLGRMCVWLEFSPRRVECSACGVRVELVPWAAARSGFTLAFEELTAYLAQVTDKTKVQALMGISWVTVGSIVARVVKRKADPDCLRGLRRIGIDEFSYRRRHNYVTVVVDHDSRRIVWAAEGRKFETIASFFELLGEEGCQDIEVVTADMAHSYTKAVQEYLPHAELVYDRFHVQRLATDALDEVRREQMRALRGTPERRSIASSRFALLKNPWNLSRGEQQKLSDVQANNRPLYRAYLLKESLANALEQRLPYMAELELKAWLSWASRSRLAPFVKVARAIRKRLDGVVAYVRHRLTNGLVEGLNNRMRMVARRAYGFHSAESLIAMMLLCCGGITLRPDLPQPTHA